MKIVTYVVSALLVVTLGLSGFFYFTTFQRLETENAQLKAGLPELDRAKKEIKKFKEKEESSAKELAWIAPLADTLKAGLADEIISGKAEVITSGNRIILNIAEQALYTPGSVTFAKDTQSREKLASLLMSFKDRELSIGNSTQTVPAQGKGRKKVPAKDGRALAAERSIALITFLEKKGANPDSLVATAYPSKLSDRGFKIRDNKTIIVIGYPLAAAKTETSAAAPAKSAPAGTKTSGAASSPDRPTPIPITPAPPKTN